MDQDQERKEKQILGRRKIFSSIKDMKRKIFQRKKNAVLLNWSRIKVKEFQDGHSMATSLVVLMLTVYNVHDVRSITSISLGKNKSELLTDHFFQNQIFLSIVV